MTGPSIRYCVEALRFRWIDEETEIGELYWDLVHVASTYRTAEQRADELFVELDRDVRVVSRQSRRKVGDVRGGHDE